MSGSLIVSFRRSKGENMKAPAANSAAGALAYRRVRRCTRRAVPKTESMAGSRADHSSTVPVNRAVPAMSHERSDGFSTYRRPKMAGSKKSPRASMSRASSALLPSSQMKDRTDRCGSTAIAHASTIQTETGVLRRNERIGHRS